MAVVSKPPKNQTTASRQRQPATVQRAADQQETLLVVCMMTPDLRPQWCSERSFNEVFTALQDAFFAGQHCSTH
jgi:hypothetical protein